MRRLKPRRAAAHIQDCATLHAPSPTKTTVFPSTLPSFSWIVCRSARIWQGCSSSVSALIVGMPEYFAKSSTSLCAKVRMIAPCTMRPSTRAVSAIGSPRPSWMSTAERNITSPPSSRTPTSKETRVRVEDFENISAQHWWRSGCAACRPRVAFISWDDCRSARISSRVSDSMDSRCFMGKSKRGQHCTQNRRGAIDLRRGHVERRQPAHGVALRRDGEQPHIVELHHNMQARRAPRGQRHFFREIVDELKRDQQPDPAHLLDQRRSDRL